MDVNQQVGAWRRQFKRTGPIDRVRLTLKHRPARRVGGPRVV
jgi:hypothetical protein